MDIASMLEVQVQEVKESDLKETVTPRATYSRSSSPPLKPYSQEEDNFFKMLYGTDIPSVRFCKIHCTGCDVHIGSAPSQIINMFEHPKLRTLLCSKCYDFYGDGDFEQGDDQTDMFCRWCANGGNLYCCSFCSNTFCSKCIKRNFDATKAKKIEEDEKWKCFVCDPTDLYPARSLCRAIIQHVQTVARILQNDASMSADEIRDKMSLDESQCCQRKRKRKRRRTGSVSEDEDDETYNPAISEIPQAKRRRTRKSGIYTNLQTNGSLNNRSDDESSLLVGENDLLPAMIPCEQTMTEGENALPFGAPLPEKTKSPSVAFSNSSKINPIPTANLLKTVQVRKLNPMNLNSQVPRQMILQKISNRPMVSIPPPQAQQKRARIILPRSRPVSAPVPVPALAPLSVSKLPNIIELDSDSDEAIEVIGEKGKCTGNDKRQQDKEDSEVMEIEDKIFEQMIFDQKQDIDLALQTLRKKFNAILSESPNETQKNTHKSPTSKVKHFQFAMRKALCRLAQINDRVVREYQSWKKQKSAERAQNPARTKVNLQPTEDPKMSLEMICVRDSASENEDEEDDVQEITLEASNLEIDQLDCYNNLTFFKKKRTVERAVGNDVIQMKDKSIQVYDVRLQDYEKSVGYSLLMKAEYDPKTNKDVLKPVKVHNEHFGKFQEQYIFHLQHMEENGIKTDDDLEELPDPNEIPLKELIEINSPFIAEMLENIAPTVPNGSASMETEIIIEEISEKSPEKDEVIKEVSEDLHADPTVATSKAVEELVKMVTKLSDELKSTNNSPENSALSPVNEIVDINEKTSKKQKITTNTEGKDEETVIAVRTLIEEDSNEENCNDQKGENNTIENNCSFHN